jgi:lysophospholipase L1-like esterase
MTDDFYIMALTPSTRANFHGQQFTTNSWGMRDQEYEQTAAPGTYRIAVLGPSFVMGSGVADNEIFEAVLEERLNQENRGERYSHYEILNFGVSGYSALQELYILDTLVLDFEPDAIIFVAHQLEERITVRNFANRIQIGSEIPYDYLREIAAESGINPDMTPSEAERLMNPYGPDLVSWTYQQVVSRAEERDIVPVWVFVPTLESPLNVQEKAALERVAQDAGFITIDLSDLYAGQEITSLIVAEWDKHPNAKAHQLIADRLYTELKKKSDIIPSGSTTPP